MQNLGAMARQLTVQAMLFSGEFLKVQSRLPVDDREHLSL